MEKIKGYKAFNPDWKCRDFQYELGETYKHDGNVNPCSSGFHFCENPLDVLEYYNNAFNQKYAEVEGSGTVINEGDKTCCSEIKIIKELTFLDLFTAHHNKVFENIDKETETTNTSGNYAHANTSGDEAHANTSGDKSHANTSGNYAHANTSGDKSHANTSGYKAHANTSGNYAHANTSGDEAHANTSGDKSHANTSGDKSHANTSGDKSHANTSGNYAHANTSGDKSHANTSGNYAHANTSGDKSHANTSGDKSHANTSGYKAHANTSGNYAHANTSGYKAHANTSGDEAISCCLGIQGKSRAEKGWIIIVDWRQDNNYNWSIKDVYKGKVGDKIKNMKIRPDYWYWFEDGKLKREKAAD